MNHGNIFQTDNRITAGRNIVYKSSTLQNNAEQNTARVWTFKAGMLYGTGGPLGVCVLLK